MACFDIDIDLESCITTLYMCESAAVYLDTNPTRKQTLKKYLSVAVPISTICKALGFNDSDKVHEGGPVGQVC